jgi:hypothetical protein
MDLHLDNETLQRGQTLHLLLLVLHFAGWNGLAYQFNTVEGFI